MTKKLILVVHGIGEQSPGETIDQLMGGLDNNGSMTVQSSTRYLRGVNTVSAKDTRNAELFPCNIRRIKMNKSEVILSEVFWADLSRGKSGRLSTGIELIQVVLGLGHLIRENSKNVFPNGHLSERLANTVVKLLHGPIAVSNLIPVMAIAIAYIVSQFELEQVTSIQISMIITALVIFMTGVIKGGRIFGRNYKHKRGYLFQYFFDWASILGALSLLLVLYVHLVQPGISDRFIPKPSSCSEINAIAQNCLGFWYGMVFLHVINLFWFIAYIVISLMLLSILKNQISAGKNNPPPLFPAMVSAMVTFWIAIICSAWVSALKFNVEAFKYIDFNEQHLEGTTGILTPIWGCITLLTVVIVNVLMKRKFVAQKIDKSEFRKDIVPRILIHNSIQRSLVFSLFLLTSYIWITVADIEFDIEIASFAMEKVDSFYVVASIVGIAFFTIYSVTHEKVSVGLGIAKDIITYFNKHDATDRTEHKNYKYREEIHERFEVVLRAMLTSEKPEHLIILSHSQGTVVAVESFRRQEIRNILKDHKNLKSTLVTMGSPISHIYERYFPISFPKTVGFDQFLGEWINIFRMDDFVGTVVDGEGPKWPQNIPTNIGGHTGYWTDNEVRRILTQHVLPEFD